MNDTSGTEDLRSAITSGDWRRAAQLLAVRATRDPGDARHWANLAAARRRIDTDQVSALMRAVLLSPADPDYLNDLGAHLESGVIAPRLLTLDPLHTQAGIMSALMALRESHYEKAARLLRRLALSEPDNPELLALLGRSLEAAQGARPAIPHYRRTLLLAPEDPMGVRRSLARHGVVPLEQAFSENYVRQLFNSYAAHFDAHLTGRLKYAAPAMLQSLGIECGLLDPGRRLGAAVDLGCGTGLGGAMLRPYCGHLTGIDLAGEMIRRAAKKKIYDRLETGDAVGILQCDETRYDLALAADITSYIGDLHPLFEAVSDRLLPDGGLLMTAHEAIADTPRGIDFGADETYSHSLSYLESSAGRAGLGLTGVRRGSMREEAGHPVATLFLAFTKLRQTGV